MTQQNWFSQNKELILLVLITLASSILFYIPFWNDMSVIFKYWDGPNYAYVAKTLYNIPVNHPFAPYGTTPAYFACHLPLYPVLIKIFSWMGYNPAMIFVTLLTTVFAVVGLYKILQLKSLVLNPFWTCILFLFFPARWMIYRHVGATEPLFFACCFWSLYFYWTNQIWKMVLIATMATLTRITGVFLIFALFIFMIQDKKYRLIWKLSLTSLGLLGTFTFYYFQYGDFFAYLSWNQKLLQKNPFQIFMSYAQGGNTHSSEFYFLLYFLYGIGITALIHQKKYALALFSIPFYFFHLFVFHEDLSRYFLVISPFCLIVAFDSVLQSKVLKWAFVLVFVPLTYVYAWKLIPFNQVDGRVFQELLLILSK